jgi:undecaprenyl-diphosphatase
MLESLILGIVQGLTEFFPVSSTAHLVLLPWFFKWGGDLNTLTFAVALHAGTLAALIFCFWRDWIEMLMHKRRLFYLIIAASVPAGIAGFLFNDYIEQTLRSPLIISLALVAVGVFMFFSEKIIKRRNNDNLNLSDAIVIGFAQALALIPGVSRSGITISAGLFRGIDRSSSARFSFLLSTPVIGGAVLLHGWKMMNGPAHYDLNLFLIGFAASAIAGFGAIKFLMSFLKKYSLNLFVYYRFLLAAVILGVWLKI